MSETLDPLSADPRAQAPEAAGSIPPQAGSSIPPEAAGPVPPGSALVSGVGGSRRWNPLLIVGAAIVSFIVLVAVVSFFWTPFPVIYTDTDHVATGPGVGGHLLGTDLYGRDIASWLMAGARTTLYVGIVAVGIAALIGTPFGILGGHGPPGLAASS